jgi:hypothetical protein
MQYTQRQDTMNTRDRKRCRDGTVLEKRTVTNIGSSSSSTDTNNDTDHRLLVPDVACHRRCSATPKISSSDKSCTAIINGVLYSDYSDDDDDEDDGYDDDDDDNDGDDHNNDEDKTTMEHRSTETNTTTLVVPAGILVPIVTGSKSLKKNNGKKKKKKTMNQTKIPKTKMIQQHWDEYQEWLQKHSKEICQEQRNTVALDLQYEYLKTYVKLVNNGRTEPFIARYFSDSRQAYLDSNMTLPSIAQLELLKPLELLKSPPSSCNMSTKKFLQLKKTYIQYEKNMAANENNRWLLDRLKEVHQQRIKVMELKEQYRRVETYAEFILEGIPESVVGSRLPHYQQAYINAGLKSLFLSSSSSITTRNLEKDFDHAVDNNDSVIHKDGDDTETI